MDFGPKTLISIIVPIYNGSKWIDQCFGSILEQELLPNIKLEVCICNDSSNDNTKTLLDKWSEIFHKEKIGFKAYHNECEEPRGVGYAKNRAVGISSGTYLCFQDIDDVMLPKRISSQYNMAKLLPPNYIIGSQFTRSPPNSTARFTAWANNLSNDKLETQIYTSHGPTVIMPTWFCHRQVFERVGGFSEDGKGTPEDLIFFYDHLNLKGKICRVNECLLIYTYHAEATTFSIPERTIWEVRVARLQAKVLSKWDRFTIWNAGKQGRKLYNSLLDENKKKVVAMCDVDEHKIGKVYHPFNPIERKSGVSIDIIPFGKAKPPFVVCVKLGMTEGQFEANLASLALTENIDYVLFS